MINALTYILTVLIWGSTWYAIEFQIGVVAPQWSIFYRFALSALVMFLWVALKRDALKIERKYHSQLFLLGLFLFSSNYLMIYFGTAYITSGLVAVCFSFLTFMNIINGRIFYGTAITREVIIGASFGLAGLILIFLPEVSALSLADRTTVGIIFCLIGATSASLGNAVASSKRLSDLPILSMNAWGMLYGALINLIFAILSGEPMRFEWTTDYVGSLIILAILGTVIAFVMYLSLMAKIGMTKISYVGVLLPLVALSISTIFGDYRWTIEALLGLVLIVLGNVIIIKFKAKAPPAKPLEAAE
ncbi:DMT family transporter [Temperatibacter marinus]|uniref:DMT family transporter n=1 Tax=Temperatibacter marinus TaxID=1456591 RepID=A0AA52EC94_9PROT|nr:DMT family transporter [Temperatibacter marinus]WND02747.1 DMT family transporter [Temperatibacter marinus]